MVKNTDETEASREVIYFFFKNRYAFAAVSYWWYLATGPSVREVERC